MHNRCNYGESKVIKTDSLKNNAEYKRMLKIVRKGDLVRIRHGVYAKPSSLLNTMLDVESIIPNGVVCLYSAWMHYKLCTTVPPAICVAVAAKRKIKVSDILPVNLYYWKAENLEFGIVEQFVAGYHVKMTDLERSVCDAVKYRNKIGLDLCAEIIRSYVSRKDRNLSRLSIYAKKLRVEKVLNTYLEIAIE